MPRTETATSTDGLIREPTSAAATSLAPLPKPLPRAKPPIYDENGKTILDWKDAVCMMVFLPSALGFLASLDRPVSDGASSVLGTLLVLSAGTAIGRRLVFGGPAPVVRHGFRWGVARVVGGAALFLGCLLPFGVLLPEGEASTLFPLAFLGLAVGGTIDHLARRPQDDT